MKINYEFRLSHVDSSESKLAKPVRDKRPTSVADTSQACERPREELRDGKNHKGNFSKLGSLTTLHQIDYL